MNAIAGGSVVSCYVDAASLLTILLLLYLSARLRRRKTKEMRIFRLLGWIVAANCIACFVFNAMYRQTAPWSGTVALLSRALWEYLVLAELFLWLIYVDNKLYGEVRKKSTLQLLRFGPLIVFFVLNTVNLFTGIVFTIAEDNRVEPTVIYYLMIATNLILFVSAALSVWLFDRKTMKTRFLHVSPMLVAVILTTATQFFTPYNIGVLGFAIGMTLLYFSIINEERFMDEDSGLYNKGYLSYLTELAMSGKSNMRSALILETDGDLRNATGILRDTLRQDGDVIRLEEKKFVMLSRIDSRSTMGYLSSLVDEAVERHNTAHPDSKVQITARCRMRTAKEDSLEFLRSVTSDKEAGDEMKGIVSMISELDRLDKELKLAADIQINTLPMNFPAFPDRHEFDLYASMTPAKEVGGDFYDFFLIDDDHLALVIADVSGKGIPAALFMMVSKTLIKNQLMSGCDPATAVDRVNQQLCERNSSMMFVTVWTAVLEISTGKGVACNAGHENPGIRRGGGDFELLKYKHGMFIGVNKKAKYEAREFELGPGDCIFVYTDGVPEATDAAGKMFGEERLTETLNVDPDAVPEELIRRMYDSVNRFVAGAPQFDDTTMLCLKYSGAQQTEA